MQAMWAVVGALVAVGLWWVLFMRKAPAEMAASVQSKALAHSAKVNTQSARTIRTLAGLTLLAWPILWLAAAGEESWMLFFAGCAAASQGIFLWGFGDIIENLAHIRHNTGNAMES
jgi:hypothetical protein